MNSIGKKQILKRMSEETGKSVIECDLVYKRILRRFKIVFSLKENIKITNFGTFKVYKKPQRIAQNPKTLEPALVSERHVIKFIPSKEWADKVKRI